MTRSECRPTITDESIRRIGSTTPAPAEFLRDPPAVRDPALSQPADLTCEASPAPRRTSPGSYFTIYGANFIDADTLIPGALPFSESLGGVSVQVNGAPVPVEAVTPWQINALLPQQVAPGNLTITAQLPDGTELSQAATAAPTAAAVDLVVQQFNYFFAGSFYYQAAAFHATPGPFGDSLA